MTSAGRILALIRAGRATTRGELQLLTGLSRSTVGQRLEALFGAGWIREGGGVPGGGPAGGRPSARLEFDPGHAAVLVADLGTRHAHAAVTDLAGRVLAEHTGPLVVADGPEKVLDRLGEWFAELLAEAGVAYRAVCGVGLCVPGPVDVATGRVVQPPIMPGWDGVDVPDGMRRALAARLPDGTVRLPVFVDNDANLMAYAEQRAGYPDCSAFLLVKAATGIGAGMVVDGRIYRGIDGGAGDIGHVRLHSTEPDPAALCRCGSRGCLAAVASGGAVARDLTAVGVPAASGSDVRALLAAGEPEAVRLAQEAGRRLGEVLGTVVTLLNPGVLMLSGDLVGMAYLAGVREELYRRAMPRITAHLSVVTAALGARAGLLGAAQMVVEELYAPEAADRRLAAR
ncbi:ROK family protein [Streptomyces sp. A7024]|uniref:ROK family protein n=1 Tax=Streptomyces coryli TaxID=1128680 RepID=A0A6G4TZK1_9ACTN|nr:ROK family protein [Streptomyces coryli]NGN65182.1 ROK family protein [Streptomyces coryli]